MADTERLVSLWFSCSDGRERKHRESIIKLFMEHINKLVRQLFPPDLSYCITLDVHKSLAGRIGYTTAMRSSSRLCSCHLTRGTLCIPVIVRSTRQWKFLFGASETSFTSTLSWICALFKSRSCLSSSDSTISRRKTFNRASMSVVCGLQTSCLFNYSKHSMTTQKNRDLEFWSFMVLLWRVYCLPS